MPLRWLSLGRWIILLCSHGSYALLKWFSLSYFIVFSLIKSLTQSILKLMWLIFLSLNCNLLGCSLNSAHLGEGLPDQWLSLELWKVWPGYAHKSGCLWDTFNACLIQTYFAFIYFTPYFFVTKNVSAADKWKCVCLVLCLLISLQVLMLFGNLRTLKNLLKCCLNLVYFLSCRNLELPFFYDEYFVSWLTLFEEEAVSVAADFWEKITKLLKVVASQLRE